MRFYFFGICLLMFAVLDIETATIIHLLIHLNNDKPITC